ncbi:MAG TPA: LytTR family DNA-binding domain-containing protein [Pyrinomonadaceae bacterium]|nr:LytTR family DNA-binding domain-containing protein [Pyrinomonadaceae bacterium]
MSKTRKAIRAMIVDDEPLARGTIRLLLKEDAEVEIITEAGSGAEAVALISKHAPDLLFLDIQMPGMNGFDVLEKIDTTSIPAIIFVTAFDQYALRAFEVHALDYLLKPFDDARFEKALRQAKEQIEQREINKLSQKLFALLEDREERHDEPRAVDRSRYLTRLMIKSASRIFFLRVEEIDWIGAEDYYVKLHFGRKSHLLRETMSDLEAKLDPDKFLRIHRSSIVNLDRVKEMHAHFNGDYIVILHDGTELKLSRSRREQLQALLKNDRF